MVGKTHRRQWRTHLGRDRHNQSHARWRQMKPNLDLKDMSRPDHRPLIHVENSDLMPLPAPLDNPAADHAGKTLTAQATERYECALDDTCVLSLPRPQS